MKFFLIAGLVAVPLLASASTFTKLNYECTGKFRSAQVSEDVEIEFLATLSDDGEYGANLPVIWNDHFSIAADVCQPGNGSQIVCTHTSKFEDMGLRWTRSLQGQHLKLEKLESVVKVGASAKVDTLELDLASGNANYNRSKSAFVLPLLCKTL